MKTIDIVLKEAVYELMDSHTPEEIMEILHERHKVRVEHAWVIHTQNQRDEKATRPSK